MQDEYVFATDSVTLDNLNSLSVERSILEERRLLELYDVALSLASSSSALLVDGLSIYDALSVLREGISIGEYPRDGSALPECAVALSSLARSLSNLDRAMLAGMYVDAMRECGASLSETDFLPADKPPENFTYVKNPFSDEAFDVFSQEFRSPKVKYATTFKECAKALADGEAGYCLFPLEEKGGARLHTVAELIYRQDFKINSVTPVFGFDAGADIKYALVSRHFSVPPRLAGDDRYLEIRISAALSSAISDILSAASVLGMSVYRLNTFTFDTEGDEATFFSLVLRDDGREFTPFLTYLALFAEDAVAVGVYKNLE